jgi:hypothetical protein
MQVQRLRRYLRPAVVSMNHHCLQIFRDIAADGLLREQKD